mmetsp:Transcript_72522/g.222072  ORF Transcript_72522/g.222072 Transcript_72522/m.222072 type:complete len:333 (-) Transcript_72522:36-1034(-)
MGAVTSCCDQPKVLEGDDAGQVALVNVAQTQSGSAGEAGEARKGEFGEIPAVVSVVPVADVGEQDGAKASDAATPAGAGADAEAVAADFNKRMYARHFGARGLDTKKGSFGRRPSSLGTDIDPYVEKHKAEFSAVLELEKPDGWLKLEDLQGVQIFKKSIPGKPLLYFKGVTDFLSQKSLADFVRKATVAEHRPYYDEMVSEAATHQFYPPYYKVTQLFIKAPPLGFISPREIVLIARMGMQPDGSLVIAVQSVDIPELPVRPGFVRCNFIEGGYVFRPLDDSNTNFRVTWTGCVDPCGSLPQWVANIVAPRQALSLARMKAWLAARAARGA